MKETFSMAMRLMKIGFRVFNAALLPLVFIFMIYFLVQKDIRTYLRNLHLLPEKLLISFIIATIGLLLSVWIWQKILAGLGAKTLPFRLHVQMYCYSALGDMLPGGIWKIVSRTTLYNQTQEGTAFSTATASLTETIIVGVASIQLYVFSTLWRNQEQALINNLFLLTIACLSLIILHPKILKILVQLIQRQLKNQKVEIRYSFRQVLFWLLGEIIVVAIGALALFVLLGSLTNISPLLLLPMMLSWSAAVATSNLFFWMPGSPILRDGAIVVTLMGYLPVPIVLTFVILIRVWSFVALVVLSGISWLFLQQPWRKQQLINEPRE